MDFKAEGQGQNVFLLSTHFIGIGELSDRLVCTLYRDIR
jgi:hypothetical protein